MRRLPPSWFVLRMHSAQKCVLRYLSGDIGCYTLGNAKPLDAGGYLFVYGRGHHDGARPRRCRPCGENSLLRGRFDVFREAASRALPMPYITTSRHHGVRARQFHHGHDGRHPGTGNTLMGSKSAPLSIERVLEALGVECIEFANPIILMRVSMRSRRRFLSRGPSAVIFPRTVRESH